MQESKNKNNYQNYIYSQKAALEFLKSKAGKLSQEIKGGNVFENAAKFLFKDLYQKNAQQNALAKFSEINKVLRQISDKKN